MEKSISSSSADLDAGDFALLVLFFRNSSNVGMALGGVSGIVGLRIDFGLVGEET